MSTPKAKPIAAGTANKSLLTPIRRVGLSRNVRGSSFISPMLTPEANELKRLEKELIAESPKTSETLKFTHFTPIKRLGLARKFVRPNSNIDKLFTSPIINPGCSTPKKVVVKQSPKPLFIPEKVESIKNADAKTVDRPIKKQVTFEKVSEPSKKKIVIAKNVDNPIKKQVTFEKVTEVPRKNTNDVEKVSKTVKENTESFSNPTENIVECNAEHDIPVKQDLNKQKPSTKISKRTRKKIIIESDSEDLSQGDNKSVSGKMLDESELIPTIESDFDDVDFSPKDPEIAQINVNIVTSNSDDEDFVPTKTKRKAKTKNNERTDKSRNKKIPHKVTSKKTISQENILMETQKNNEITKSYNSSTKGSLSLKKRSSKTIQLDSDSEDDFIVRPKRVRRILSSTENSNVSLTSECVIHLQRLSSRSSSNLIGNDLKISKNNDSEQNDPISNDVDVKPEEMLTNTETNENMKATENMETDEIIEAFENIIKEPTNINALRNEICEIDKRVQDKENQLANLKQSKLYKTIHNVKDLTSLTNIWKNGCQEALRDLLIKLREHADIDMNKLLKNLNIPSNILSFDSETDSFI